MTNSLQRLTRTINSLQIKPTEQPTLFVMQQQQQQQQQPQQQPQWRPCRPAEAPPTDPKRSKANCYFMGLPHVY
jgi:hypothetical protein